MKYEIKNIYGETIYTAEIDCDENTPDPWKKRLAVLDALKNKANLSWSNLSGSDLSGANLSRSDLSGSDLSGSDLRWSDLRWSDLSGSDLRWSDLSWSDLSVSDLRGANLSRANLRGARGLEKQPAQMIIIPEGDVIGYKKIKEGVCKLLIPADARRSNASGRKCRAEKAVVLELPEGCAEGHSLRDAKFIYLVGETVSVDDFCDDWAQECAAGIHFYITRQEAEEHK